MAPGPDLRPRTVGELLDGSFFLYRRYFGRFLILATIVSLPTLVLAGLTAEFSADILREWGQQAIDSFQHPKTDPMEVFHDQLSMNMRGQMLAALSTVLQALSRGGAIAVMAVATCAAVQRSEVPGVRATLRRAAPRMPAAILAYASQATVVSIACCCVPIGVVVLVLLTPVPAIVMFETGGTERAVRRMLPGGLFGLLVKAVALPIAQVLDGTLRSLVLGWHGVTIARGSFYVFFVTTFVSLFVTAVTTVASGALGSFEAAFWLQYYAEVVCMPVVGTSVALWYVDLRVRREAADLMDGEIALA